MVLPINTAVGWIFGQPFVKRRMLSVSCPVCPVLSACLSVTLVYMYSGQTAGWIKMKHGREVGLGPGHIVSDCVCLCVCVSVRGRMPTLLHGTGCNFGEWLGWPLVVHYWADLQSVHGLRCYGNTMEMRGRAQRRGKPPGSPHAARMPHAHTTHAGEDSPRRR